MGPIVQAIGEHESGNTLEAGCDSLRGGSGELGCFQIMPDTWRAWSIEQLGYHARPSIVNQKLVVSKVVKRWILAGMTERQIAWKYNSGRSDKCIVGVNKYGVRYDSCGYAVAIIEKLKNNI